MAWTREEAAHLLRRAGFGGSLTDVETLFAAGQTGAIDRLLNYEQVDDPVWADPNPLSLADPTDGGWDVQRNLLFKLIVSKRPLQSRLTWFWHGHFTSSMSESGPALLLRQLDTWRSHATGSFLDFLLAMHKDGAMLRYLDGASNSKVNPNENFARENFELFTTGLGPYTENDVREAARALTGYLVDDDGNVTFHTDRHDTGAKTILGQTGNFGADDVMRLAFGRPETARRICTKLYQHFVSERLNLVELISIQRTWNARNGDLRAVLLTLLTTPGFWDPRMRGFLVKGALEFCVGLVQRLELSPDVALVSRMASDLAQMGQSPFYPPNVGGYPTGIRLAGASMLLARYRFAYHCIYEVSPDDVVALMTSGLPARATRDQLVSTLAQRLGVVNLGASTRNAINDYIGTDATSDSNLKSRTLGTLYLLACSPEFQMI